MAFKLYEMDISGPVRSSYLTVEALGLDVENIFIDVANNKQLSPEFMKLNPQHTVPTFEEDGKAIWDSHAINIYLVEKYAKDDSLYPKDLYKRAKVDEMMHFDSFVVFCYVRRLFRAFFFDGVTKLTNQMNEEMAHFYDLMENLLKGHKWAVGDTVTLADFSLLNTYLSINMLLPLDAKKYLNIAQWIDRGKELPYFHVCDAGSAKMSKILKHILSRG